MTGQTLAEKLWRSHVVPTGDEGQEDLLSIMTVREEWATEAAYWMTLRSDPDAAFDREVHLDASSIAPHVTWGTNPAQAVEAA